MIFSAVVLQNFGIYRGRHQIDLEPTVKDKPIILFGGLNGGGKTTLLEAIQLVLFGNKSNVFTSLGISYSEYLGQSINRFSEKSEGSSLELTFKRFHDGEETLYKVVRSWSNSGKRVIKDEVNVFINGAYDELLSTHWSESVEEFLPSNISSLFFFDGEKIEQLAHPQKSSEIIKSAIHGLLGLDSVKTLASNIRTIEKRRLRSQSDSHSENVISIIESEINNLEQALNELHQDVAHKQSKIDSLNNHVKSLRIDYKTHGGELLDMKDLIEANHKNSLKALEDVHHQIQDFASHSSPLSLVEGLVKSAVQQSQKESVQTNRAHVLDEIKSRDEKILRKLSSHNPDKTIIDLLKRVLNDDILTRETETQETAINYLNVTFSSLSHLNDDYFEQIKNHAEKLHADYLIAAENVANSERELSSIPEEGTLEEISSLLKEELSNLAAIEEDFKRALSELDSSEKKLESKKVELDRVYHKINEKQLGAYRNKQILFHTQKIQQTLIKFQSALVKKHIKQLESLIEKCFKSLIRKDDLIDKITIDPDTFSLEIISKDSESISLERLSAGERQLVAISVLWGLARASGRPLPVIIDTPLGRLDSQHRTHIVKNYFPFASHQVVLLSTDTEIDDEYRKVLKTSIGKEYRIDYSGQDRSSNFVEGYFND